MKNRLFRACLAAICAVAIGPLVARPAASAQPGIALILSNADYTSSPALPGCALSGRGIAAALRNQGFDVIEAANPASGQLDATLSGLGEKLAAARGAPAIIYVCGYASAFNGRPFILPVSANVSRPADVLSQGVLAKVLTSTITRAGTTTALIILDVVPAPGQTDGLPLTALDQPDLPPGLAILGAVETTEDAPSPVATALIPLFKEPKVEISAVFNAVMSRIEGMRTVSLGVSRRGDGTGILIGAAPASAPAPAPPPAAPPPPAQSASAPPSAPAVAALPEESQMTEFDRRTVQLALTKLGYYGGAVDGIFGADTRAAIRRFQHELHAPMTGQLTQDQSSRLLSAR
jgi:hypothetical protein